MHALRVAAVILSLVLMLGVARNAAAENFIVTWGEQRIAIMDISFPRDADMHAPVEDWEWDDYTYLCLGQLGSYSVPFTAMQGLIGFGVIVAALVVLPTICLVRKRGAS